MRTPRPPHRMTWLPGVEANRRVFLQGAGTRLGAMALAWLLRRESDATEEPAAGPSLPHFPATAQRVVFLHQSGAPSQIDLFDHKPELRRRHGEEIPESVRRGQRLTGMTAQQTSKPLAASQFAFARHGASGLELSELLPHTARIADDLCLLKSMHTEAINHDPAINLMQTGFQLPGRPSLGAWVSYGLGSEQADLPAFVVLISGGAPGDQPLKERLWGAGCLAARHQGVRLRGQGEPIVYLENPPGIDRATRRQMLDALAELNRLHYRRLENPETLTRLSQYELAFRVQTSVPELTDLSQEPAYVRDLYGSDVTTPGSYAANCLLARRLLQRGVQFVQLYHRDWDHHKDLPAGLRARCRETDQASAGLVLDLKRLGLLEDTLVVWAGEFGRTAYCQGALTRENYGRDHHPRCFAIWLAGGGVRSGVALGRTDEFSYNIEEDPVHVHDLQATILHCLGIDHRRLTVRHRGSDLRLTDVGGQVIRKILLRPPA